MALSRGSLAQFINWYIQCDEAAVVLTFDGDNVWGDTPSTILTPPVCNLTRFGPKLAFGIIYATQELTRLLVMLTKFDNACTNRMSILYLRDSSDPS